MFYKFIFCVFKLFQPCVKNDIGWTSILVCTILTKNLEGYVLDETMGFVTQYLQEFQHVYRKKWDAKGEEGVVGEVLEGVVEKVVLSSTLRNCIQLCVDKYRNHGTMDIISYFSIPMVSLLYYT